MKILVLTNLYPPDILGGYELGCSHVVDALARRGHTMRVLACTPRQPVEPTPGVHRRLHLSDLWNPYVNWHTPVLANRLKQSDSTFVNSGNVQILIDELAEFQPDVVYVSNILGLGGLGLLATLKHLAVPWVWHLGDCVPMQLCMHEGKMIPDLAKEFTRQAEGHYLACSSRVAEEVESGGVGLRGHVEVVPYWVSGEPRPVRTEFLKDGQLRIVSAGRLVPYKGFDRLVEAIEILRQEGRDNVSLDLYGVAENWYHYPFLIKRLDLEDRVRLMGFLPQQELAARYADYDVFAFPTWEREPFGMAPLEAAAFGGCVPVISRVCGLAEWLVHGIHCVKAGFTAEALADAFRAILDGRVDLATMSRRVNAAVWRDFHIESVAGRFEAAFRRAAEAPRGEAGSPDEAYRLALLGEKLGEVLIMEAVQQGRSFHEWTH